VYYLYLDGITTDLTHIGLVLDKIIKGVAEKASTYIRTTLSVYLLSKVIYFSYEVIFKKSFND
jgi:hypothetical protein